MIKSLQILKTFTLLLLVVLILVPGHLSAQKKKKPKNNDDEADHKYDYDLIRNDPADVSPLSLCFHPLVYGYYGTLSGYLGVGISASYEVNEKIEAISSFTCSYATGSGSEAYYRPSTLAPYYNFEIGATWFFSNKTVNTPKSVFLSQSGNVAYYTKIDMDHQQKFGFRGTLNVMNNNLNGSAGDFIGYDVNAASFQKVKLGAQVTTNDHIGYISLGICSEKIRDYQLKFVNSESKPREEIKKVTWYLDLLLAPVVSYDNVTAKDSSQNYNLDKYSPKSGVGFRAGINFTNLKTFGGSRSLEFGDMPGSTFNQFYFIFKLGFAINPKASKKD